ncbi:MAG: class I tRNA ligase family protein [Patescibacteria group bacterium]|nr:class I tRNA ligase family protein [Patescibacteria group bacterium]
MAKNEGKDEFVFYEGPPTANGHPGMHHLEARAFKDAIPRYKTMRGYHVRRKGGWDTHGLPVEIQVEKELGLKSKKEIESYGIGAFNEKCKESVWKFVHEWEEFTERMGYWVDLKDPYVTYRSQYIESLWNIMKRVDADGRLYKDYKVVPWCPRCGTALSSHELAQGYQDVKDLSVYIKFKVISMNGVAVDQKSPTYLLAWTTTPWTLPGNVGLAVNNDIDYVEVALNESGEHIILAKERLMALKEMKYSTVRTFKGKELVGSQYEALYPFIGENIDGDEKKKMANAYKVYPADFVTTTDGTGIVHTAVMYGQDDFVLGTNVGLPKFHLVNDDGTFKDFTGFLKGAFVKDPNTDVAIIKDFASDKRGYVALFAKEKYEHSYPFCWRCKTPLIYYARDSWYVRMSELRDKLVEGNKHIHWEPEHIKEGRFGEWLSEVKDWAISRERYWGTPLPVWICRECGKRKVVGSIEEISKAAKNEYFVMRHGEAENNAKGILSGKPEVKHHLTAKGVEQVRASAKALNGKKFDIIFVSPFTRTEDTLKILVKEASMEDVQVITDKRLGELGTGEWDGKSLDDFLAEFGGKDRFVYGPQGGENYADIKKRMGDFLYDIESGYSGKNILIISHETPIFLLCAAAKGLDRKQSIELRGDNEFISNAEIKKMDVSVVPHNAEYETDLHRPHIDEVILSCECGGEMNRVKEVMDVWFDSGAMPFAQDHYPFENKEYIDNVGFPAHFISEAIDQTRGWFYTLHAIGTLLGKGPAYRNVVCLGHILDPEGKKMSKSLGNIVNPHTIMDKYSADAARLWMYSVNQPGDSKNFDEKTVDVFLKKVFNLAGNVLSFYKMYSGDANALSNTPRSDNILDKWIIALTHKLVKEVSEGLDQYKFFEPTRAIRDYVADLSQWYIRRSRDRFKAGGDDTRDAVETTGYVLITLSKVMAPLAPFFGEHLYRECNGEKESVHLEDWPKVGKIDDALLADMAVIRQIASRGLEARMKAGINVRQPLSLLKVKDEKTKLSDELLALVKDEVNVKTVEFDGSIGSEVVLNTDITPELKEEGDLRELLRKIQDMRKEKGLTVGDKAVLISDGASKGLVDKYRDTIAKATGIVEFKSGNNFGVEVA